MGKMGKALIAAGAIILVLFVTSLQSLAADVINGCYNKTTGKLRIVSAVENCAPQEIPISWNLTGPQGEPGPQGEQGEQGEQGSKGDKGDTGETGLQGEQGIQGPQGERGLTGDKGDKGDKGDTGAKGSQGKQGEQGEPGPDGQDGTDGLNCWDLNGNQVCDDIEDKNIDDTCDALDCKGPVHVYDADGQYLGILIDYLPDYQPNFVGIVGQRLFLVQIFIPGHNKSTYINLRETRSQTAGDILKVYIYYDDVGCTGNPYARISDIIVRDMNNGRFYYGVSPISNVLNINSHTDPDYPSGCSDYGSPNEFGVAPVLDLNIPEDQFPFSLPVALPLRYE